VAHLEPAPAPELPAALMAAAQQKAREMQDAAAAPSAAALAQESWWDRIRAGLGTIAWQPAVGTAFMVLLVAGVGIFFLRDVGPRDDSFLTSPSRLEPVPQAELQSAQPAAPAEPAPMAAVATPPKEPAPAAQEPAPPAQDMALDSAGGSLGGNRDRPPPALKQLAQQTDRRQSSAAESREAPARRQARRARSKASSGAPTRTYAAEADDEVALAAPQRRRSAAGRARAGAAPQQAPRPGASSPLMLEAAPSASAPTPWGGTQGGQARGAIVPTPPLPEGGRQLETRANRQGAASQADEDQGGQISPTALFQNGLAAHRSGQHRQAIGFLTQLVRHPAAPQHLLPQGLHHLALSQRSVGQLGAAVRSYDQLLRRFPSYHQRPQALLEAARLHAQRGNRTQAEHWLNLLARVPGWAALAQRELAGLGRPRSRARRTSPGSAAADEVEAPAEAMESEAEAH
jgi:tetratricopeptide (TPR) repeat protein